MGFEIKISIIVPVYKVERELDRCVKSLLGQTYQNIEIILVDDGSPDCCPEMCDEFARQDNRVKVVHKKMVGFLMQEMLDLKLHQESIFFMWILTTILILILANDS